LAHPIQVSLLVILAILLGFLLRPDSVLVERVNWSDESQGGPTLSIAFLSDLHLDGSEEANELLENLINEIEELEPQAILLGGDYGVGHRENSERVRSIAHFLGGLTEIPTFAVLGNHEVDKLLWSLELQRAGITVVRNSVMTLPNLDLCLRGLGDVYSRDFQYVDFPKECEMNKQVSITHDPAGAFDPRVTGLVLAGHTHCGQIGLPYIGPIWAPTSAPRQAWCGRYQDQRIQLHVSAGLGTSILPIRIMAPAAWALVTL
jgi:predicted MPP superfamily phosphohydrolase